VVLRLSTARGFGLRQATSEGRMSWDRPTSWNVANGQFAINGPWCAVPLPFAGGMKHIEYASWMP
jgi:hypothetical protein